MTFSGFVSGSSSSFRSATVPTSAASPDAARRPGRFAARDGDGAVANGARGLELPHGHGVVLQPEHPAVRRGVRAAERARTRRGDHPHGALPRHPVRARGRRRGRRDARLALDVRDLRGDARRARTRARAAPSRRAAEDDAALPHADRVAASPRAHQCGPAARVGDAVPDRHLLRRILGDARAHADLAARPRTRADRPHGDPRFGRHLRRASRRPLDGPARRHPGGHDRGRARARRLRGLRLRRAMARRGGGRRGAARLRPALGHGREPDA